MRPWVLVVFALLLLTTCTARPGDPTLYPSRHGQQTVTVFLVDNGYHTDIALPAGPLARTGGATAAAARQVTPRAWVLAGWGDARFYVDTGMSFERLADGARALLAPGNASAVRLIGIGQAPDVLYGGRAVKLELSPASFELMVRRIDRSLGGEAERAPAPDKPDVAFFKSIEVFGLFHLCNHWTAEVLNAGGVGVTPVLATTTAGLRFDLWARRVAIDEGVDSIRPRS